MSVSLRNVLISDAVDLACVELLQSHGINVTCKYKLPKDQLLQEIKVSTADNYELYLSCLYSTTVVGLNIAS
jgi:hypothetical protein